MKENLCKKWRKVLTPTVMATIVFMLMLCLNIGGIQAEAASGTALMPEPADNLTNGLRTTSYLTEVDSGYMRVYYDDDNDRIGVEYYDANFCILSKTFLEMELNVWGGFYAGSDAYYIVEGQNNTDEDSSAEVIRVIKYSFDWERLGAAAITSNSSLFGGEVRYPFNYGCVEMTEYDGTLYIVTGHQGYVDDSVGQGHQGFLEIAVDEDELTGKIVKADLWHSFAQYIENSGSYLYVLEQSEGSRCTTLKKIDAHTQKTTTISLLDYGGSRTSSWAISCYASVDDMALSSDTVLCVGTSIDQSLYDSVTSSTAHNIYLTVTPMSDFTEDATNVIWLTDFADDGSAFLGVKLTKVNDDRFMVSWEEYVGSYDMSGTETEDPLSEYELHYLFVDADGNVISEEFTADAPFSDCHPVVAGSKIVYYASSSNTVNFYTIDSETGAFAKKVYRVAGDNVTWDIEDGVLTFSGSGAITADTDVHYRYPVSSCRSWYSYSSSDNCWKAVRTGVTKIVIKSGITSIAANEFENFPNLVLVSIEPGLKSIGDEAFVYCSDLDGILIPDSVTSIGTDALWSGYYSSSSYAKLVYARIYCHSESYAASYAKENGIKYTILDDDVDEIAAISECQITLSSTSYTYDGTAKTPAVTVKYKGTTLVEGTDYSCSYSSNTNAGTAKVKVTGKGAFLNSVSVEFTIKKASQNITVSGNSSVGIGETMSLGASAKGELSYSSSNTSVATVSSDGVVTGVAKGTTTITISAEETTNYNAASLKYKVSVKSKQKLTVSDTLTLTYGGSAASLGATCLGSAKITYVSSDENVVQVSSTGKVTPVNAGTATITVTAAETDIYAAATASVAVTVEKKSIENVRLILTKTGAITGAANLQDWAVIDGDTILTEDEDFWVGSEGYASSNGVVYEIFMVVRGRGNYTGTASLEANVISETSVLESASRVSGGVKLTWQEETGAVGYEIYRKIGSGSFSLVKIITDCSTVSWTDTGANSTFSTYTYYVRAYTYNTGKAKVYAKASNQISLEAIKCSVSSVSNVTNGLKVTWGKVSGATGYYVYRKISGGSYSLVKTITDGSTVSWSDTSSSLTSGKDYNYKVIAYCKASDGTVKAGAAGTTKTCKYLAGGVVSSVVNTTTGQKVTWTKVTGANGYYVYRKITGGSYSLVKTITGGSTVSWADTSTHTSGKDYNYKVVPYFKSSSGAYTVGVSKTTKTAKFLTAGAISAFANTSSGLTVKWSKVTGASGYYVYRKKAGASSYTLVKTITSGSTVSYTDTAVKNNNNTSYTYYVQPYFKAKSGNITKASYTTRTTYRLVPTSISSLTNSASKKMTVKWSTKTGVTGYQIQYSTSSSFSSGNKTVKVTGASSMSKIISGLTKGKTYYVRIQTYKTVNGVTYYSGWCTKKSVKISK